MKRTFAISAIMIVCSFLVMTVSPLQAGTRFGGGIHYLRTLGDIKDTPGFDENAMGFMGSALLTTPLIKIEGDIEYIPNFGIDNKDMWQPQAYALIGNFIYGGVGIGIGYIDGGWQDNPFYALRAGVDFFLAGLDLDAFASFRFQKVNDLKYSGNDDLNSITFGVLVRFGSN